MNRIEQNLRNMYNDSSEYFEMPNKKMSFEDFYEKNYVKMSNYDESDLIIIYRNLIKINPFYDTNDQKHLKYANDLLKKKYYAYMNDGNINHYEAKYKDNKIKFTLYDKSPMIFEEVIDYIMQNMELKKDLFKD